MRLASGRSSGQTCCCRDGAASLLKHRTGFGNWTMRTTGSGPSPFCQAGGLVFGRSCGSGSTLIARWNSL
jgi:hypothetical protein